MTNWPGWRWLGAAFAALIAGIRVYECTLLPSNTGDIARHLIHGLYISRDGLAAAGRSLVKLDPNLSEVAWSGIPYNYPIVAIAFFVGIVQLVPNIFFAKLALTTLEAINARLIYKHTGERTLGLLYWASPVSIWEVSREGQFEPVQNLFVCLAVSLVRASPLMAAGMLALAIQTKLSAVFLVPWLAMALLRAHTPRIAARAAQAFVLGFMPSAYAQLQYPMQSQIFMAHHTLHYNPYYWNVFEKQMFAWNDFGLIAANQIATYGMLALLIGAMLRLRTILDLFAPTAFMIWCKLSVLCQSWYMLIVPSLLLPIEHRRTRLLLFAWACLLDPLGILQLLIGPLGYSVGNYYQNLTVFTRFAI